VGVVAEPSPLKAYEEEEVIGKEPGGVLMLKVNCMRLMVPGQVLWKASQEHSHSTARRHQGWQTSVDQCHL
jgi:hypothetical protein